MHHRATQAAFRGRTAVLTIALAVSAILLHNFVGAGQRLLFSALLFGISGVFWFSISRSLGPQSKQIDDRLRQSLDALARGEIECPLPDLGESDLAGGLEAIRNYLKSLADNAKSLAVGNPSPHSPKGEMDLPGKNLAMAADTLLRLGKRVAALTHGGAAIPAKEQDGASLPGMYGEMLRSLSDCRQHLIQTVERTVAAIDAIAQGQVPARLNCEESSEVHEIAQSINRCADAMEGLGECIRIMKRMTVNDYTQKVTGNYPGIFKDLADSTNETRRRILSVIDILEHVADGDYASHLEAIVQRGKASDQDTFRPATIRMMQSIDALATDATMLFHAAVDGRLHVRGDVTRHRGQFRNIMQGVNDTLDAVIAPMQEAGQVLRRIAEGDLTVRVAGHYKGDHAAIESDINSMADHLAASLRSIETSTEGLTAASRQLQNVSRELNESAELTATQAQVASSADEQVNQSVNIVAASTEEMNASIREIAHNAAQSAMIAQTASEKAQSANLTVGKLGVSSAEIGDVIKVITSIAQQTNLLALNATIEAARAGEAGKGFAVVANEVKELAKETAKATEDIGRRIEAVQHESNGAVAAISEITEIIAEVSGISATIASAVEEQTATTNEMTRNIAEAAQGSTQISGNVRAVAQAAQRTSEGAVRTQTAASELSDMAASLHNLVMQFKFSSTREENKSVPRLVAARTASPLLQ